MFIPIIPGQLLIVPLSPMNWMINYMATLSKRISHVRASLSTVGDDNNTEIGDMVPDLEDFTGWISPHFEGDT